MIDSILSRTKNDPLSVTKAELSDIELADILETTRKADDGNQSDESPMSDATPDAETSSSSVEATSNTGETEVSTTGKPTQKPTRSQPLSLRPVSSGQPERSPRFNVRSTEEQQSSVFAGPLAIALATSLASTLREHARREKEQAHKFV